MKKPINKTPRQSRCGYKTTASEINAQIVRDACNRFFDSRGMPRNGYVRDFKLDGTNDESLESTPLANDGQDAV